MINYRVLVVWIILFRLSYFPTWAQTEDVLELFEPEEMQEDEILEPGESRSPPPPAAHTVSVYGHVDFRGWAGPRLSSAESVSGQNEDAEGNPLPNRPQPGDLYGGARIINTFFGVEYLYGSYLGAVLELDIMGNMNAFNIAQLQATVGMRRAYGWIDILRLADRDKEIGVKLTVGYLSFEEEPGFTAPHRLGGSATNFRMGTHLELFRAAMIDPLLWRLDVPVYVLRDYLNLSFTVTSDLDFSRTNSGWTIMGEVTADRIRFGDIATWGINLYYHHWQGGDTRDAAAEWRAPGGNVGHNNFSGRGFFGSHLIGGSTNITFHLPHNMRVNLGFMGDYQWYFGEYLIRRFEEEFIWSQTNGIIEEYYGKRKGSLAFQTGIHFVHPRWASFWAGWVNRTTGVLGFSHDEGVVGMRSNGFLALRLDLLMLEAATGLSFYNGLAIGLTEARKNAWSQMGRFGYDIGLAYRPINGVLIRTGWHAGSWFLGQIVAPGNTPSRSRDGQFYIRVQWAMRASI